MPNITTVLNEQIRRLARREITANTKGTRRASAQYRHDLAALKRQVADLTRRLGLVEKAQPKEEIAAAPEVLEKARFRAMGVRAHRAKLGLSAKDYATLVGVSGLTIYQWESGKARPRQTQMAKWLAVRSMGRREAMERLEGGTPAVGGRIAKVARVGVKRQAAGGRGGGFGQTAQELILSLLKGGRALTTRQLAGAWQKAGRGGTVDNALSKMVKARELTRTPLGGKRGSRYSVR